MFGNYLLFFFSKRVFVNHVLIACLNVYAHKWLWLWLLYFLRSWCLLLRLFKARLHMSLHNLGALFFAVNLFLIWNRYPQVVIGSISSTRLRFLRLQLLRLLTSGCVKSAWIVILKACIESFITLWNLF